MGGYGRVGVERGWELGREGLCVVLRFRFIYIKAYLYRVDERWLNRTTACTYPQPWLSRMPSPLSALGAAVSPLSTVQPTVPPGRPAIGWLVKNSSMYVGRYGHLLFGNFTVTFEPSEGTVEGGSLLFQVSHCVQWRSYIK